MKYLPGILILVIPMLLSRPAQGFALTITQENGTWQYLSTPKSFSTMEVTPWGIFTGEFNSNWNTDPYNGVFVSTDLGESWKTSGLEGRGINDLAYNPTGNLYAAVYYWGLTDRPGVFKSVDRGATWIHMGLNYSTAAVTTCDQYVLAGTYSHGLWVLKDGEGNWTQKKKPDTRLASGDYFHVVNENNIVVASNPYESYISYDCGETWEQFTAIPSYSIDLAMHNNVWLTCHESVLGIRRSTDMGKTFSAVSNWGLKPCGSITYYRGTFYAASYESNTGLYAVSKSNDWGLSWTAISPPEITSQIKSLAWLASEPGYIFALSQESGIYRYKTVPFVPKTQPFLSKLWQRNAMSEQTDTITSYFDHSYPLLGYAYKSEGFQESDTTTNFWGDREKIPTLYYSSHEGVDFGLVYGTPILAPASGYATYSYTIGGGNTIKIDHPNGYQTQYLHLQSKGLFIYNSEKKWVDVGQQVGLVGLTGNTTGPHLHFGVRYDKNLNGLFTDDVPDGRVDPYSWLDERKEDPWEVLSWKDSLGDHNGCESAYLWEDFLEVNSLYVSLEGGEVLGDSVKLSLLPDSLERNATLKMQKATQVNTSYADPVLKYVPNTSTTVTAYDNIDVALITLKNFADITFDISQASLLNIASDTLKAYYFNSEELLWEELPSIWDEGTKTLTGLVDQLGSFAVYGKKTEAEPPVTGSTVTGVKSGLWYTTPPVLELSAKDGVDGSGVDKTFYSLDGGDSWEEYQIPIPVNKEGIFAVLFRSSDKAENYETVKDSVLLRIDTLGKQKAEVILPGVQFKLSSEI